MVCQGYQPIEKCICSRVNINILLTHCSFPKTLRTFVVNILWMFVVLCTCAVHRWCTPARLHSSLRIWWLVPCCTPGMHVSWTWTKCSFMVFVYGAHAVFGMYRNLEVIELCKSWTFWIWICGFWLQLCFQPTNSRKNITPPSGQVVFYFLIACWGFYQCTGTTRRGFPKEVCRCFAWIVPHPIKTDHNIL